MVLVAAGVAVGALGGAPVSEVQNAAGGADGILVTAVSPAAFSQAVGMLRRGGTLSLVGLPPGTFDLDIFDTVLNRKTIRGSIVGTRMDLIEALAFAGEGKVSVHYSTAKLDEINGVFDHMRTLRQYGIVALDRGQEVQVRIGQSDRGPQVAEISLG